MNKFFFYYDKSIKDLRQYIKDIPEKNITNIIPGNFKISRMLIQKMHFPRFPGILQLNRLTLRHGSVVAKDR